MSYSLTAAVSQWQKVHRRRAIGSSDLMRSVDWRIDSAPQSVHLERSLFLNALHNTVCLSLSRSYTMHSLKIELYRRRVIVSE